MRKIVTSTLVGLAAVMISAADLSAQICNGTASFSAGKMRVGFGLRMPDGGTFFDGEFAMGTKSGVFGGGMITLVDPEADGVDGTTLFGGFIGKTMTVDAKKTVEMCPQGFVQIGDDWNSFGGGVSFGKLFAQSSFDLVPFAGASLHRDDNSVDSDFNLDILGGAGFVLNKTWTIRPYLTLPLTNDGESMFGIMAYLHFGGTP
jgi:hypothetical protein